ncbi:hypothetical protein BDN70DRAFT_922821 [Pholiota conissans]|uniref:F-box domain-containing protein n=1 Tax=Pholiota conissans TaxID=109636 RepID=A0A9P5YZX5_9AGAR|nr:hypothetical protein BDN70DRAFT_922821 [Pholiota conissans]
MTYCTMPFISPFTDVLRSNFFPSPLEIGAINQELADKSFQLDALSDELKHLQEQLDAKMAALDVLTSSIDDHLRLLTPFRGLPDDILGEIFACCLPTRHGAIMHRNEPPLVLGYVCKRWRSVAYNMPRLWKTLHIVIPKAPEFEGPIDEDIRTELNLTFNRYMSEHQTGLAAWLARSKSCALSVSMHDLDHSWSSHRLSPPALSYFGTIFGVASRIRHLEIDVNQRATSGYVAALPATMFPNLSSLSITFTARLENHNLINSWKNASIFKASRLKWLSLLQFPHSFDNINIDWSNLTLIVAMGLTSNVRKVDVYDALTIFTNCPRLNECDIEIAHSRTAPTTYPSFHLKYLHTLSIVSDCKQLGDLFQGADIPNLQYLRFHSRIIPSYHLRSPLLVILSRPSMRLKLLAINIEFFTLSDLVDCFQLVPWLKQFSHDGHLEHSPLYTLQYHMPVVPKMVSALLHILTPAANHPLYLPNLTSINIEIVKSKMIVTDMEILNFVRGRLEGGSKFAVYIRGLPISARGRTCVDFDAVMGDYIADRRLSLKLNYANPHEADTLTYPHRAWHYHHLEASSPSVVGVLYL